MRRPTATRLTTTAVAATLLLAACGSASPSSAPAASPAPAATSPATSPAPAATAPVATSSSAAPGESPSAVPSTGSASEAPEATANPAAAALASKPWATATLTDVTSGETFTIASLAGKPLFIETMAIWCTNCRQQQARFTEAFGRLAPGTAEYVVLTVEPSETAKELARYEADRGFTGRYVVAGRDLSRALEAEFGPNVLNQPSVPLVFITPGGEIEFRTGPESVEKILERAGA